MLVKDKDNTYEYNVLFSKNYALFFFFYQSSSTISKSTHGTTIGIPKMSIGFKNEFLKHMVKTEESTSQSRLTTESFQ